MNIQPIALEAIPPKVKEELGTEAGDCGTFRPQPDGSMKGYMRNDGQYFRVNGGFE